MATMVPVVLKRYLIVRKKADKFIEENKDPDINYEAKEMEVE